MTEITPEYANDMEIDNSEFQDELLLLKKFDEYLDGQAGGIDSPTDKERQKLLSSLSQQDIQLADAVAAEFLKVDGTTAFYYLTIPLKVFPQPGTYIQSVEIDLHFNPGEMSNFPFVQDIFPSQKWQEILKVQGQVDIGISDLLEFSTFAPISTISAVARIIKPVLSLRPHEPRFHADYEFLIREPIVMTTGPGGNIAKWRFNGRDHFEQEKHLQFGLIFGVPLTQRKVRIAKILKARRRNQNFSRLLAQDLERIERMIHLVKSGFKDVDVERVVAKLKNNLRNEWNIVYSNLPVWDLSEDMCH